MSEEVSRTMKDKDNPKMVQRRILCRHSNLATNQLNSFLLVIPTANNVLRVIYFENFELLFKKKNLKVKKEQYHKKIIKKSCRGFECTKCH